MAEEERKGFLARWSRRKLTADDDEIASEQVEAVVETQVASLDPEAQLDVPDVEEEEDDEERENREAAEAVDIDALTYQDDFKIFLKRGVPETVRRKALQKLWRSNPVLANLDGLNDYDEDFANPALNVYKSAWEVGRGFLTKAEQAAQYASGRLTVPEDEVEEEVVAEAEVDPVAVDAATVADGSSDLAPEATDETAPEFQQLDAATEKETEKISDDVDAEPAEEPRRVSLRSRWAG